MSRSLHCSACTNDFEIPSGSPVARLLDELADEGPWFALGDGETPEDRFFTVLQATGDITCPRCHHPVALQEEDLSDFARELLTHW